MCPPKWGDKRMRYYSSNVKERTTIPMVDLRGQVTVDPTKYTVGQYLRWLWRVMLYRLDMQNTREN